MINKNILYIVPSMDMGGVEIGILEICKKNKEVNDFNIFVLTSGGKLVNKLKQLGANVIILNVKSKNPFTVIKNISKIKKIIKNNNINLVQAESRIPAWSAYFACKKLNVPFITTIHGAYSIKGFFKKKYNSIMFKSDAIIAVSKFIKSYSLSNYRKYIDDQGKIRVIYRGIDEKLFSRNNINEKSICVMQNKLNIPDNNTKTIITLPARLTPIKGQYYFLEALSLLKNKNYLCFLVGAPSKHKDYCKKVEKYIYDKKLNENVKMCGDIDNMQTLYMMSDIVISSTIVPESFGRVSIEAQSMEKIFIGTALGGTLETVKDGITGFLAPYDDKKNFAKLLEYVINLEEDKKDEIRKNARRNVLDNFTFDAYYMEIKELYNEFLEK